MAQQYHFNISEKNSFSGEKEGSRSPDVTNCRFWPFYCVQRFRGIWRYSVAAEPAEKKYFLFSTLSFTGCKMPWRDPRLPLGTATKICSSFSCTATRCIHQHNLVHFDYPSLAFQQVVILVVYTLHHFLRTSYNTVCIVQVSGFYSSVNRNTSLTPYQFLPYILHAQTELLPSPPVLQVACNIMSLHFDSCQFTMQIDTR